MTDKLDALTNAHLELAAARFRLEEAVTDARAGGATWQQVGDALGISKQAATKTYGNRVRSMLIHRRCRDRDPDFFDRPSVERRALRQQWHDEDGQDYGQS